MHVTRPPVSASGRVATVAIVAVMLIAGLDPAAAEAPGPLPCPADIATRQEALGVPAGLQAMQTGERRTRRLRVGFRAVAADSDVMLAPDGSDLLGEDGEQRVAAWAFAGD